MRLIFRRFYTRVMISNTLLLYMILILGRFYNPVMFFNILPFYRILIFRRFYTRVMFFNILPFYRILIFRRFYTRVMFLIFFFFQDIDLQKILHSRQLGLKLIANVTYGYTSASFSGRMPCVEVADSVVAKVDSNISFFFSFSI